MLLRFLLKIYVFDYSCIHHLTQKEHNFYQRRRRDHEEEGKNALTGLALYKPQRITVTKKMMHCGEKSRCSPLFQIRIAALLRALQALSAAAAITGISKRGLNIADFGPFCNLYLKNSFIRGHVLSLITCVPHETSKI